MAKKISLFTYVGPALLVALGAWTFYSFEKSNKDNPSKPYYLTYTFKEARRGNVSVKDYIMDFEDMPEVMAAKTSGTLKGFLYDPTDQELEDKLSELFKGKLDEKVIKSFAVPQKIREYHTHVQKHNPVTIPTILGGVFGKPVKLYMAFGKDFLNTVESDNELRSRIIHELQHVEDMYYGFSLDGKPVDLGPLSSSKEISGLIDTLREFRAYHKQLEDLLGSYIQTGNSGVREAFFGTMALYYLHYYEELDTSCSPSADTRKIRDQHFECFKDITVQRIVDGIRLDYDILGKKDSIEFGMK